MDAEDVLFGAIRIVLKSVQWREYMPYERRFFDTFPFAKVKTCTIITEEIYTSTRLEDYEPVSVDDHHLKKVVRVMYILASKLTDASLRELKVQLHIEVSVLTKQVPYELRKAVMSVIRSMADPFKALSNIQKPQLEVTFSIMSNNTLAFPFEEYSSAWEVALQRSDPNREMSKAEIEYAEFLDLWAKADEIIDSPELVTTYEAMGTTLFEDMRSMRCSTPPYFRSLIYEFDWTQTIELFRKAREARDSEDVETLRDLYSQSLSLFKSTLEDTRMHQMIQKVLFHHNEFEKSKKDGLEELIRRSTRAD